MADFKNLTSQIEVIGTLDQFDNSIAFYNKTDTSSNIILGVKADAGDLVMFQSANGVETKELERFLYTDIKVPTSTDLTDLVETINNYIHSGTQTTSVTAAHTATVSEFVLADTTLAGFTVTLPPSASSNQAEINIKKIDSTVNVVTVDGDGTETIDGDLTISITTQYESVTLFCDGSNWHIQ